MPYRLGIDLGTTFTAAAICRPGTDGSATAELVPLGSRGSTVPSVLFLDTAGTTLVGDAAERRALTDPGRVVREFKRRLGDETPMLVGDDTHHAHDLTARLVRWVVDKVTEREGEPPDGIAVTHPAAWGPHREELLRAALAEAGVGDVLFLTEPQAAAMQYASAERIEPGSTIAVYDLGGGTFDAAVVRKTETGDFELLGRPEGIERLGGIDFDELILDRVLAEVPEPADETDPMVSSAMVRLRRECTEAKEALSSDTEATIPVLLLQARTQVRLVREEFEALIRSTLEDTVGSLLRAVEAADVTAGDLSAVLLVGGSSRIPLVTQLISAELGRPVSVDADPKSVVAMGAALAAHRQADTSTALVPLAAEMVSLPQQRTSLEVPVRPELDCEPPELAPLRRRYRKTFITLAVFVALVLGVLFLPAPTALSNKVFGGTGAEPAPAATTNEPEAASGKKKSGGQGRSEPGARQANSAQGPDGVAAQDAAAPAGAPAAAAGQPAGAAPIPGQAATSSTDSTTTVETTQHDSSRDDVTPPSTEPEPEPVVTTEEVPVTTPAPPQTADEPPAETPVTVESVSTPPPAEETPTSP
jgi:molecular chaperone DnaK